MLALEELNLNGRVIAVDPRGLDDYSKCVKTFEIIHLNQEVINYQHVVEMEYQYGLVDYDLVWDIRSDYIPGNDVLYNIRIEWEIDLLNTSLLGNLKYVRHSIKVHSRFLNKYK